MGGMQKQEIELIDRLESKFGLNISFLVYEGIRITSGNAGQVTSSLRASLQVFSPVPRSLVSKRCLAISLRVSDTQCHSDAPISPSHAHQGLRLWGSSEQRPAGTGSASRWRSRQFLFLRPGSGSGAGIGKVGPWWGRGWEDGVARLGTARLGLRSGVGTSRGWRLPGALCGPGPTAARTQVMAAASGFPVFPWAGVARATWGPGSPLSTSSSLTLPSLRHAFPWSFVPFLLLRVSPRPCAVAG